jgi:urease accessory protein
MPHRPAEPGHQRAHGGASLRFAAAGGRTRLADLHQEVPLRVLFPAPEPGEPPLAALVNTAGGLAGGDSVRIRVAMEPGTLATVSTPAAEKVYRSLGPASRVQARLSVAAGGALEWIPQETILFDGARLARRIEVDLAPGARILMAEMLVFGRHARGESLRHGGLLDIWRLSRDGGLLWADGLSLGPETRAALDNPFGFAGAAACATLVAAAEEGLAALRDALRAQGVAATLARPGLLVARWLGSAALLRGEVGAAIRLARGILFGLPPALPRLWTC